MLESLKKSLKEAPVVKKGDYDYVIHPVTDGIPLMDPEILKDISNVIKKNVDLNFDKIVCIESMGIHLATAFSLETGIPFNIIRKRKYGLKNEVKVDQSTGYSYGELYINYINKGDRILIIDDVISTGGTLINIIKTFIRMGVEISDIVTVVEKGEGKEFIKKETGYDVLTLVKLDVKNGEVVIESSIE